MKGNVRSGWRRLKGQSGNTVILMNVMCLMLLVLTLASLDLFSILASRRYAQTDADAAAIAGVRAIQPIVAQEFMAVAGNKVNRLIGEAMQSWADDGSKGDPTDYVTHRLAQDIPNPYVVSYIVGQVDTPPGMIEYLMAVLSPAELGCSLKHVALTAESSGQQRAQQFLRDADMSSLQLTFPVDGRPWVRVEVQREIPTVFVNRVLGHRPTVQVTSGATLNGLDALSINPCP